ncbi:MAG: hypothetical protein LBF02_00165 [Mycoplasmataceae bacterium]|nr:hypothetical protein [Mycoplasmataceae bacterium]
MKRINNILKLNQEKENELTFLAKQIPSEILNQPFKRVTDIYIPQENLKTKLRLRQKGDKYEIAKKVQINKDDASSHIKKQYH